MKYNRPGITSLSSCGRFEHCARPLVRYRSGYRPNNNLLGQMTFVLAVAASSAVIFASFVTYVTQDVRPSVEYRTDTHEVN